MRQPRRTNHLARTHPVARLPEMRTMRAVIGWAGMSFAVFAALALLAVAG